MMTATLWCTRVWALLAMVSRNRTLCLIYSRYFRGNIMIKASNTMNLFISALLFVIPMLLVDSQAAKAQPDRFGIRIAKIPNYKGQRWTLCHVRNENPHTVTAYFDVYPLESAVRKRSPFDHPSARATSSGHGAVGPLSMIPWTWYNVFDWPDDTLGISCTLTPPYPALRRHA